MDEKVSTEYQVLIGNVQFRKGDMFMFCDSAHFYEASSSLNAFGNVRMEQGDTLFVYADELDYNGADELATFYGDDINPVRLINKDVELETYTFYYDIASNIGYYDNSRGAYNACYVGAGIVKQSFGSHAEILLLNVVQHHMLAL